MKHISVLLEKTIELLDVKPDGTYMDGTLGRGGHTSKILEKLDTDGRIHVFDLDIEAIKESKERLNDERVIYHHANYKDFDELIDMKLDGIILDLGVSSPQFDDPDRGFSYRYDAKLDMRMDQSQRESAYDIVNTYEEAHIYRILRDYGEEPYAKRIAHDIVVKRALKPIETTFDLVDIIKEAYPKKALSKKGHPAKQTFQALRIATNHELDSLEQFLEKFPRHLKKDGTCAIITFHSLEDRLVKRRFKELSTDNTDRRLMLRPEDIKEPDFKLVNHKAIVADDVEIEMNSRAKSAKLRVIKKEV